jgi:hypothetical protein
MTDESKRKHREKGSEEKRKRMEKKKETDIFKYLSRRKSTGKQHFYTARITTLSEYC